MQTDYLIVGQGIAGTLLSSLLEADGADFLVLDTGDMHNASYTAGAVINPASGKHWSPAAHLDLYLPEAVTAYTDLGHKLSLPVLSETQIHTSHNAEAEQQLFARRLADHAAYLAAGDPAIGHYLNEPHGSGTIRPVYRVAAQVLLQAWRRHLAAQNRIHEVPFGFAQCRISGGELHYAGIRTHKLIFCEGASGRHNPFFQDTVFLPNRGDVLLLHIPGLPEHLIYQGPLRLIPLGNQRFWCGSNYRWNYDSLAPDMAWRKQAELLLRNWLRLPFFIEEHRVAERPTTPGQQAVCRQHAVHPGLFMLNGLGTRGFSAGPYLCRRMLELCTGAGNRI